MKILIQCLLSLILISCNDDDVSRFTSNATVLSNGWSDCDYIVQLENQKYYFPNGLSSEFQENNLQVIITYFRTNQTKNCGFSGNLEIINISEIETN